MGKFREEFEQMGSTEIVKRFTKGIVADRELKDKQAMASSNVTKLCQGKLKRTRK